MNPVIRSFTVRFNTPAFLGDAFQNGRWRTPPFKAELRRWWRVAYAAERNFRVDVAEMRKEEGRLFGHAWLENDYVMRQTGDKAEPVKTSSRRSHVLLRLNPWNQGSLSQKDWPLFTARSSGSYADEMGVSPDLYLGYGPLELPKEDKAGRSSGSRSGPRNPTLKNKAAIAEGESAMMSLLYPNAHRLLLERTLFLMHEFGALGGRCRNGWGSYELVPADGRGLQSSPPPLRDWKECLHVDWPHAIGKDDIGALIWRTVKQAAKWEDVIAELAYVRWALRKHIKKLGPRGVSPQFVHWLGYPVTGQGVKDWDNLRLPNMLRFKVRRTADGTFEGLVFHIPHLPPPAFRPRPADLEKTWRAVYRFLDDLPGILTRA